MRSTTICLLLCLSATAGQAADFPVLRGTQDDFDFVPRGRVNWGGFYVGVHGGYSASSFKSGTQVSKLAERAFRNSTLGSLTDVSELVDDLPLDDDRSATFGGFAGYNYQSGNLVLGLEADYTHAKQGSESRIVIDTTLYSVGLAANQRIQLRDYMTGRVRAGYAMGVFLPFVTGGIAAGRADARSSLDVDMAGAPTSGCPAPCKAGGKNTYSAGIALGAGVDIALASFAFLRAEYQFVRFGSFKGAEADIHTLRAAVAAKF